MHIARPQSVMLYSKSFLALYLTYRPAFFLRLVVRVASAVPTVKKGP